MPAPANAEALEICKQTVLDHGATPAVTAILVGRPHVGLSSDEEKRVLQGTRKVAERDLSVAQAQGWDVGVTTVSATVALSHAAGISVFATGGIGGVHRRSELSGDVSADLDAIANHPVITVCAGAKAFLDLPRTLKYLETVGVPVLGWQHDWFPAFYTRSSGLPVPHRDDDGDEVLIPAPDYPLWTAAVALSGGTPVHYRCDEQSDWMPDLADIEQKITDRTKALVIINPNNPTGAVYDRDMLVALTDIARRHRLLIYADEIYDKILYDDATHTPVATLAPDVLTLTFNGLSKAYRVAGYRCGWMAVSGPKERATSYLEGLAILSNMRLCANMPAQHAGAAALGGRQSITDLVLPGGRLRVQRDTAYDLLTQVPGVTCVKPKGALYVFPRLGPKVFGIKDDRQLVLDLLRAEKIMIVHGTGFNWPEPDYFRIVPLPHKDQLHDAITRICTFLDGYRQR